MVKIRESMTREVIRIQAFQDVRIQQVGGLGEDVVFDLADRFYGYDPREVKEEGEQKQRIGWCWFELEAWSSAKVQSGKVDERSA